MAKMAMVLVTDGEVPPVEEVAALLNGCAAAYGLIVTAVLLFVWHGTHRKEPTILACKWLAVALALLCVNWAYRAYCPIINKEHTYSRDVWSLAISDFTSLVVFVFVDRIYAGSGSKLPRRFLYAAAALAFVEWGLSNLHSSKSTLGLEVLHYRYSLIWSVFAIYITGSAFAKVEGSKLVRWSSLAYALLQVPCYVFVEQAPRHEIALGTVFLLSAAKLSWIVTVLWECHTSAPEVGTKNEVLASSTSGRFVAIGVFVVGFVMLAVFLFQNTSMGSNPALEKFQWGGTLALLGGVVTVAATIAGILSMLYQKKSLDVQDAIDAKKREEMRSSVGEPYGLSAQDVDAVLKKAAGRKKKR